MINFLSDRPGEWVAEHLAYANQGANNPYEPFSGVTALFRGDNPEVEARADWIVESPYRIAYVPLRHLIDDAEEESQEV